MSHESRMNQESRRIKSFTDLDAWRIGYKLALDLYDVTNKFPREEVFGIINQLRRAIVSYTSNIAEGFSRNYDKEKVQFYYMALGSMTEVENQLIIAKGIGYLNDEDFDRLAKLAVDATKLINGLIKSTKARGARHDS